MTNPQPVQFEDICKAFAHPDRAYGIDHGIIDHITFEVAAGACLSLVGDNGSGKSTILRIACGLVSPDSGRVRILGGDPVHDGRIRGRVSAMFEGGRALYGRLTPAENLAYFTSMKGFNGKCALLRFRELSARFATQPYEKVVVRKLSRGTQQKFSLICSLAICTDLWVLDEPTLGMDESSVAVLGDVVHEHLRAGGAVLTATHDARFARDLGQAIHMSDFKEKPGRTSVSAPDGEQRRSTA